MDQHPLEATGLKFRLSLKIYKIIKNGESIFVYPGKVIEPNLPITIMISFMSTL